MSLPPINKQALIAQILAQLDAELRRYAHAARVAQAEATDEQSRAENKYDTRGLEASYLAHGQSRQVQETARAREQFASLVVRDFDPGEAVGPGAFVRLEGGGESLCYFLGPAAGGMELIHEGREVLVITAQSPVGRALVGKRAGDFVNLGGGISATSFQVVAVR